MENIKIEYIPIKDLKPYEKNARHHEDYDISQIMVSIKKYGFNDPVGIWSDANIIVEGHGRVLAGKKLKMREVPCIRLDHLTDEERREYCLIHNKTAELSEWDFDLLAEDVPSLDFSDFDIDWGLPEVDDEVDADETEQLFEDIEKLEVHYGVPYQGNKSRIADRIVDVLPEGERLVDLFGGGGR